MTSTEVVTSPWRKSSHSFSNGNCSEVAAVHGVVLVRDSRDPDGPVLAFSRAAWGAFAAALKQER